MAGGGPLPVREYTSADQMRRDAAALRARIFAEPAKPKVVAPIVEPEPEPTPETEINEDSFLPSKTFSPEDFQEPTAFPMSRLMTLCSVVSGVSIADIKAPRRYGPGVKARQIFFWLAKKHTDISLPRLGRFVGGRDHTTCLYAVRKVEALIKSLNIETSDCPVAMAECLWAAEWPKASA